MSETTTAEGTETGPAEEIPATVEAPVGEPAAVDASTDAELTDSETGPDLFAEVERWKAQATKWQALSKKNEARAKENANKAQKLDEIEEANKSELQKEREARERAETALAEANTLTLRATKAASEKVSMDILASAVTEEQMDAAIAAYKSAVAEAVAAAVAEAVKNRPAAAAPAQIVTGSDSTKVKQIESRAQLQSMTHQEILDAVRDGRLDGLMGKNS